MKVVHCKKDKYDIYIGRPSKWGNPFNLIDPKNDLERKEVIDKYRKWITTGNGKFLLKDLNELKGKILACYCSPKPCHGDVLIELIELEKEL